MEFLDPSPQRLLLVARHRPMRDALLTLSTEEGYVPTGVSSLEEALATLAQQSYSCILADLHVGVSPYASTPAHVLRRRAHPTPVGLLTEQALVLEQWASLGFAFALPLPVDASWLLTEVAASLQYPLSREQQRQARCVERFLRAWGLQAWTNLLRLCADEVLCYPTTLFPQASSAPVQDRLALLGQLRTFRQRYHSMRIEASGIYGRPQGLAVRFSRGTARLGQGWEISSGSALFSFAGERICQIGRPLSEQQQQGLLGLSTARVAHKRSS
jgi:CheY-like chemotaxis protein